jgi:hypothetical protein
MGMINETKKVYFWLDGKEYEKIFRNETPFPPICASYEVCLEEGKKNARGPFSIYEVNLADPITLDVRAETVWTDHHGRRV